MTDFAGRIKSSISIQNIKTETESAAKKDSPQVTQSRAGFPTDDVIESFAQSQDKPVNASLLEIFRASGQENVFAVDNGSVDVRENANYFLPFDEQTVKPPEPEGKAGMVKALSIIASTVTQAAAIQEQENAFTIDNGEVQEVQENAEVPRTNKIEPDE